MIRKKVFQFFFHITFATIAASTSYANSLSYAELGQAMGYSDFKNLNGLSASQRNILQNYKTSSAYECLKQFLTTPKDVEWAFCDLMTNRPHQNGDTTDIENAIAEIDLAFEKSPRLPEGLILYRGQKPPEYEDFINMPAYTSTSVDPNEALIFYKGAMLVIRIPKGGFPGLLMGAWEQEILLPRNTMFKILDTKTVNGQLRILVEPCEGQCQPSHPYPNWEKF